MQRIKKANKVCHVYFIRHGESNNNIVQRNADQESDFQKFREPDPGMSDRGVVQCKAVCRYLKTKNIQPYKMFCSCYKRGLDSAQYFQDFFQKDVLVYKDLGEIGKIHYEGKGLPGLGKSKIKEQYPNFILEEDINENGWNTNEKKETFKEGYVRAQQALKMLAETILTQYQSQNQNQEVNYFVIAHGQMLDFMLALIMKRKENVEEEIFFYHENTGITKCQLADNGEFFLNYMNDYNHLQDWFLDEDLKEESKKIEGGLIPKI